MQCNLIVHFYPDRCCQTQQPHHLKIENVALLHKNTHIMMEVNTSQRVVKIFHWKLIHNLCYNFVFYFCMYLLMLNVNYHLVIYLPNYLLEHYHFC